MMDYLQWSVNELFQNAASVDPEPGGGGASAISGGLGSGMLMMVGRITLAKAKEPAAKEVLAKLVQALDKNIESLKSLAQKDMAAYQGFMAALALPRSTPEEQTLRESQKEQAAVHAANIPLEIAKTCCTGLQLAKQLAALGSKYCISDVGTGAYLLEGALKGALLMVEANLGYIKNPEQIKAFIKQKEQLTVDADELRLSALEIVRQRMI